MADGEDKKVFVSMNAFTDDLKKIGIPTLASEARFQCAVNAMDVYSNMPDMATGINLKTGNIEFWPDNYGMRNSENIVGASSSIYDFGDEIAPPADGYGSMQIHNYGAGQTLIAINHWVDGRKADIGLGNGPISDTDWTFTSNAESYTGKRLRVYVRQNSQ